ncbi:MAG TPA: hypothetical protein VJ798_04820 [Rhizomicrobium sp.]|nr:hypothetical protein [Rhizomicrobium sp.]
MADGREIFVEFVVQGNFVKVTAIDSVTGVEASIVGPANAAQSTLAEAARRKLEYVLRKRS